MTFLIWLILYVSVLRTHAFVINSVESRFIFRVGLFNALPWSSARMSSCLQISYCHVSWKAGGGGRGGEGLEWGYVREYWPG